MTYTDNARHRTIHNKVIRTYFRLVRHGVIIVISTGVHCWVCPFAITNARCSYTCIYMVGIYEPNMCMWYYYSIIFILYRRNVICVDYMARLLIKTQTHIGIYWCNIWKLWLDLDIYVIRSCPPSRWNCEPLHSMTAFPFARIYSFISFPYTTNHRDEFTIRQTLQLVQLSISHEMSLHIDCWIFLYGSCNRFDFFSHRKSRSNFCLNDFNNHR